MTQIICLANSWKLEERCIAGINPQTGKWIRPVCDRYPKDGRVPKDVRLIAGKEPSLLDVLEIPLENNGPDFGFESENFTIKPGTWKIIGKIQPTDMLKYCSNSPHILHNDRKYVTVDYFQSLPFEERHTLQLVYATKLSLWSERSSKWKGSFVTQKGQHLNNVTITDPEFIYRLEFGYIPQNPCLLTVSLSLPYRPGDDWEGSDPCWKLIAGVMELSNADLILVEMNRIGWTIQQGRNYLIQTYNKRSRQQLTEQELQGFLDYLKSLPN